MKVAEYGVLNFEELIYGETISLVDAIKDLDAVDWPETVINGESHIIVTFPPDNLVEKS